MSERDERDYCNGKLIYTSPTEAVKLAKWLRRKHDQRRITYRCDRCRGWHLATAGKQQDVRRGS